MSWRHPPSESAEDKSSAVNRDAAAQHVSSPTILNQETNDDDSLEEGEEMEESDSASPQ